MRHLFIAGLCAVILPMTVAQAQPSRIGNRANGFDYQPSQGAVTEQENNAGIAPSPTQQRRTTDELEQLNQKLQTEENNDPQVHPNGAGKVNPDR